MPKTTPLCGSDILYKVKLERITFSKQPDELWSTILVMQGITLALSHDFPKAFLYCQMRRVHKRTIFTRKAWREKIYQKTHSFSCLLCIMPSKLAPNVIAEFGQSSKYRQTWLVFLGDCPNHKPICANSQK